MAVNFMVPLSFIITQLDKANALKISQKSYNGLKDFLLFQKVYDIWGLELTPNSSWKYKIWISHIHKYQKVAPTHHSN